MKIMSYNNTVNFLQSTNVQSKGENVQSVKKEQDAVTIGAEARRLFDSQIQLQDVPEEIAEKIASIFKDDGKIKFVESEEQQAIRAEQQARLDEEIEHNVLAIMIPHIQTNDKLVNSLKGASQQVFDATYTTIAQNFFVRDVGNMTEEQRQAMISLGLEKAQYIADNYLTGQQAKDYMDAMTTIAKFAVNGVKNDDGKVSFAIEKGPLVNAPDDYIHIDDLVKEAFPEKWQSFKDKILAATEKQDQGALLEAFKDYNQLVSSMYTNQSQLVQKKIENYNDWQETIKNTVISNHFSQLDKTSLSNFGGDIMTKNSWLSDEFLAKDLKNFQRYLTRNH